MSDINIRGRTRAVPRILYGSEVPVIKILFSIFLILHGLVHLLYAGQSQRIFELQPGMTWPDGSWAFSRLAGVDGARILATILLIMGALLFVSAGAGSLFKATWWRSIALAAAAYSSVLYLLLWDGGWQDLPGKGAVGILINAVIAAAIYFLPQLQLTP